MVNEQKKTCGQCHYYDQHKSGMFCKNPENMLAAFGEIRILDTTPACPKFEIRLPQNLNARLLFLAEKHLNDALVESVVQQIKLEQVQFDGALQQSQNILHELEVMNEMEDNALFGSLQSISFSCFAELQNHHSVIHKLFQLLSERLEKLGEELY